MAASGAMSPGKCSAIRGAGSGWTGVLWTTAFRIIRLPTRTANTRSRPGNRIQASGYAAVAPIPTTRATEPMETTTLLRQARPMRAVRALLSSTSW